MASKWYIKSNQNEIGPKEFSELVELVRSEDLTETDLVRSEWNNEWQRADKVVGLFYMARKSSGTVTVAAPPPDDPPESKPDESLAQASDDVEVPQPGWMRRLLYLIRLKKPLSSIDESSSAAEIVKALSVASGAVESAPVELTAGRQSLATPGDFVREVVEVDHKPEEVDSQLEKFERQPEEFDRDVAIASSSTTESAAETGADVETSETATSGLSGAIDAALNRVSTRSSRGRWTNLLRSRSRSQGAGRKLPVRIVFRLVVMIVCVVLALQNVDSWSTVKIEQVERNSFLYARQAALGIHNGRHAQMALVRPRDGTERRRYFPLVGECSGWDYVVLMETLAVVVGAVAFLGAKFLDSSIQSQAKSLRTDGF